MARVIQFADAKRERQYLDFREFLNTYKIESGCVDCGYNTHPAALVLDHRDPTLKTAQVSTMFSYSRKRLLEEIAKCDVRCANCHQVRTFELGHMGGPRRNGAIIELTPPMFGVTG